MNDVKHQTDTMATEFTDAHPEPVWTVGQTLPEREWLSENAKVIACLDEWRQGDLVTDVSVTWLLPLGLDQITGIRNLADWEAPASSKDLRIPGAVIASQTCDIGFSPPGDRHPFVLLSPLVPESALSTNARNAAKAGEIGYLFPVTPDREPFISECWFADIRLLVPASKSLLLQRKRIPGFAQEEQAWRFAESLGHKFRRPAVHSALSEDLPDSLDSFIRGTGKRKPAFTKVEQVRMHVSGDRLHPERVTLWVLESSPLNDAEKATWATWEPKAKGILSKHDINMGPTVFISPHDMRAITYRETVPLQLEHLSAPRFW